MYSLHNIALGVQNLYILEAYGTTIMWKTLHIFGETEENVIDSMDRLFLCNLQ